MRSITIAVMLSLLLFSSKSAEVEQEEPPVSTEATECFFEGYQVNLFGQYAGYNIAGEQLKIYPYFNLDRHITVEKLLLSDRHFWSTIAPQDERKDYDGFSIYTVENETYGYMPISEDYAFFAYTDNLPAGYVREVLKHICLPDT